MVFQLGKLVLYIVSPATCIAHAKLSYLFSDIRKIRKRQDLAVNFARTQCCDLFHGFAVDKQHFVVDSVHPLDHLAEGGSIITCVDCGSAVGSLSVQKRRVRADDELVDVELNAVFRYKTEVGEFASAIAVCESSGGAVVDCHG